MEPKYYLSDDAFVIEQYNNAPAFSSFLPGIAGVYGKPLWAFYVNRAQGMASFGMNAKDGAIMEFYPATTAYRRVSLEGFRTFIKVKGPGSREGVYEPFAIHASGARAPRQTMSITPYELRITETAADRGLRCEVTYHTVPGESFPALVRTIRIENLSPRTQSIELIDGMPKVCCFGLNEWFMKHMSRTIEAWMETSGVAEKRPFYRLRVDAADVAETRYITSGNFYLSMVAETGKRPAIIVDPAVVFGASSDLASPYAFQAADFSVPLHQIDKNTAPSAFSYCAATIGKGRSVTLASLIGHASSVDALRAIDRKLSKTFFAAKRAENRAETLAAASSVSVFSGMKAFDAYTLQTNLDNVLRGGLPIRVGKDGKVVYVYNRKHGDLERDYNNFVVQAEYFAQGNGNFRDANQNRRLSVWLEPAIGTKDIRDFYELIQLDGYNPLVIKGDRFTVPRPADRAWVARTHFGKAAKGAGAFLAGEFTLGGLLGFAEDGGCRVCRDRLLADVLAVARSSIQAEHGEGFWVDHWTYNLDLIESYLALYPEKKRELLFEDPTYRSFDSDHIVKERAASVVRNGQGRIRQYHAVGADAEKKKLLAGRKAAPTWARTRHGHGELYICTLAAKMLLLVTAKISTLDPAGRGIDMEADKPGWCDSLNGLPGLFGSSASETFELARLVRFLSGALAEYPGVSVTVPAELAVFLRGVDRLLTRSATDLAYWRAANALKDAYRKSIRLGVSGKEVTLAHDELERFLDRAAKKLERAAARAHDADGVPQTYYIHEPRGMDARKTIPAFASRPIPLSLEGVVHAMKIRPDAAKARALYRAVRKSPLYDKALGMYKVNAPLDKESLEIGRSRAFTPGWLENESVWLHMEYKYLLEVLRRGLYDEFFADMKTALIPFQDPARYGRSILENSSFITPSCYFDRSRVGAGYYARLSGATVEFLHMLQVMNLGLSPFRMAREKLAFTPSPVLQKAFFSRAARQIIFRFAGGERHVTLPPCSYGFSLFGKTLIVYENPGMHDTFGPGGVKPVRYAVRYANGREVVVERDSLGEPCSRDLRSGRIDMITIRLG